jgi:hypothetical protein
MALLAANVIWTSAFGLAGLGKTRRFSSNEELNVATSPACRGFDLFSTQDRIAHPPVIFPSLESEPVTAGIAKSPGELGPSATRAVALAARLKLKCRFDF